MSPLRGELIANTGLLPAPGLSLMLLATAGVEIQHQRLSASSEKSAARLLEYTHTLF